MIGSKIALFVAQSLASYGIEKGLDAIFKNREGFEDRLYSVINETIRIYDEQYSVKEREGKIPFYKSELLINEFLKYRIFHRSGYEFDLNEIKSKIGDDSNIINPTTEELNQFFKIFDGLIAKDTLLKKLQLDEDYKQVVFDIHEKVDWISSTIKSELKTLSSLLEKEYEKELQEWYDDINDFKPNTALIRLEKLESRIKENQEHTSDVLIGGLYFLKAKCYEALGKSNDCYEHYIKAYLRNKKGNSYLEKACISYFLLSDEKYKPLLLDLENSDPFNHVLWGIRLIESDDKNRFLMEHIPNNVILKDSFRRLVYNINLTKEYMPNIELLKLLKVKVSIKDLPDSIKYEEFHSWIYYLNISANHFFSTYPISFTEPIVNDKFSSYFYKLLQLISNRLKKSELSSDFEIIHFYNYWLQFELEPDQITIHNIKESYDRLKPKDSFRTFIYANCLQKSEGLEKGLEIINNYKGEFDENLKALEVFCSMGNPASMNLLIEYLEILNQVDENNISRISAFVMGMHNYTFFEPNKIEETLDKVHFTNPIFKQLIKLLLQSNRTTTSRIPKEKINQVVNGLKDFKHLVPFLATVYLDNSHYIDCVNLLEPISDETESIELYLYIKALNEVKTEKQVELLRLLKVWRLNFSFNSNLLRIELDLRRILQDWDEVFKICHTALKKIPDDEPFFTNYIISVDNIQGKKGIEENLQRITNFNFRYTQNTIIISSLLKKNGFNEEALEMLYKKAVNPNDKVARLNYFGMRIKSKKHTEDFDSVLIGTFVLISIDDKDELLEITEQSIQNKTENNCLGKSIGDEFIIITGLSQKIKKVKVLKIMNKYQALSYSIMKDFENPAKNLPVESFKYDDRGIEGFEKTLIESFGQQQENRREKFDENLNAYYSYKYSLMELALSNFDSSYIESYYYLTSEASNGFRIKPKKYYLNINDLDAENFVIDFSSGLLFYELSKELNLNFGNFIVSKNIIGLIDSIIEKAIESTDTKMSVVIKGNKVIPHFYDDSFHSKRIKKFTEIKEWFQNHAVEIIPEEKISVVRKLYENSNVEPVFEVNIDNYFLAQRTNHTLISDDIIFSTNLQLNSGLTSTELFLEKNFPDQREKIYQFLLKNRYVGLTLSIDDVYTSYIDQNNLGLSYIYKYALLNLTFKENYSQLTISVVVGFLRKIALNPFIPDAKYLKDAVSVLVMLIPNLPDAKAHTLLKNTIEEEFKYMGSYLDITFKALLESYKILNNGK